MELDPVDEGVALDRTGVGRATTKGFEVGLPGASEIVVGDRGEWQQLDVVDLDQHRPAPVDAADFHLWPRPEPVRDRDGSVRYSITKIGAELHAPTLGPGGVATLWRLIGERTQPQCHPERDWVRVGNI